MFRQGLLLRFLLFFLNELLQVPSNPHRIRWDFFVTNTSNAKGVSPVRPSTIRNRAKPLPPVRNSNSTPRTSQISDRRNTIKTIALPPIENSRKKPLNLPVIFILSSLISHRIKTNPPSSHSGSANSTKICSKLIERHPQICYLSINDIANIDDEERPGKQEHRYEAVQHYFQQHRSISRGFLIAGHLDEKNFCKKWQEKVSKISPFILFE